MLQGKHYRFTIPDTSAWQALKSASRRAESWALSLADALPPYYVTEGILESKRIDDSGGYTLLINGSQISVDHATYHILDIGERLRVRYTRSARAINIDRYTSPNGHR